MGLSEQEYRQQQTNNLRQLVKQQDQKAKERIAGTSFGWSTAWEKKEQRVYQTRPERDVKQEELKKLQETAKAGKLDSDAYLAQDINSVMSKQSARQPIIEKKSAPQVIAGRNVSGMNVSGRQAIQMAPEHEAMMQEMKQRDELIAQQKEAQKNEEAEFLQVDDWCLFDKFVPVTGYDDYLRNVRNKISVSEITGVYLIANITKRKMYVGYGAQAINKCGQHFRMRIGSTDPVPAIREDMLLENVMGVNFVKLKDTDFDTIEELSDYYIRKYDCRDPKGYNKSIVLT